MLSRNLDNDNFLILSNYNDFTVEHLNIASRAFNIMVSNLNDDDMEFFKRDIFDIRTAFDVFRIILSLYRFSIGKDM